MAIDYSSTTNQTTDLSPDMPPAQVKAEQAIRWVYYWLFWSVFITVPWMGIHWAILESRSSGASTLAFMLAVLLPALGHAILFFGLGSPHLYVRRHTQQALMLIGLRALSALFFMGLIRGSGVCLWIIVNGFLWVFGTVWGLQQIKGGDCWLMRRKGEQQALPRPWAAPPPAAPAAAPASVPSIAPAEASAKPIAVASEPGPLLAGASSNAPANVPSNTPADPQVAFERGQSLVRQGQRSKAVACFMVAFRNGPLDLRRRAVAELEKLGEVETF